MKTAPSLFVSHGAPTFALEPGTAGEQLSAYGASLRGIKAVLVVSPHWQTNEIQVMTTLAPETIHDFYGFPSNLYDLHYPAKGCPLLAKESMLLLAAGGFEVALNNSRGLDHGCWVPLLHLLPNANIPIFQVSMSYALNAVSAYQMGQLLAPMRKQGVLILGSGSITHNLNDLGQNQETLLYVSEFACWIKETVLKKDLEQLLAYRKLAPNASRAHPTDEHLLPLFIALGASTHDDHLKIIDGGLTYDILCMDSYRWQTEIQSQACNHHATKTFG